MFSGKRGVVSRLAVALLTAAGLVSTAAADVIFTANGTAGGNTVKATADFNITGNVLTITLTNISPANGLEAPTNTLSGLEFLLNKGDSTALTPVSASSPNAIFDPGPPPGCNTGAPQTICATPPVNVGGEWGLDNAGLNGHYAIGSAGYITTGLPMDLGNFGGINLADPVSLDGINFGVISNNIGPLNGGLTGQPLIQNSVVLTLTGVNGLTETQITSVSFLYGTAPDVVIGGSCIGSNNCGDQFVPEPGSLALIGIALSGLAVARRRWHKT